MTLLIFSFSAWVFAVIFLLFYNTAVKADHKNKRLSSVAGEFKFDYDAELEKPFVQRFIYPLFKSVLSGLSNAMPKSKTKEPSNKTERNLKLAGIKMNPSEFAAVRLMISGCFVGLVLIVSIFLPVTMQIRLLIVIFALLISFVAPVFYLRFKIGGRQEKIRNQLPDVLDLLSVSIEAGLSFDLALIKIAERLKGPLMEEFNYFLTEIQLGRQRKDALRSLAERTDVEDLKAFVSSMIQAEQLGIPVKNVLNSQAQQLRIKRKEVAEQKAMKAPIKMMIPLVVFVFPVLFIILLGPSILQAVSSFKH